MFGKNMIQSTENCQVKKDGKGCSLKVKWPKGYMIMGYDAR